MDLFHQAANAVTMLAVFSPSAVEAKKPAVIVSGWGEGTKISNGNSRAVDLWTPSVEVQTAEAHMVDLRRRFAALRGLEDGWAGPKTVRPDPHILASASRYLDQALKSCARAPLPAIVPIGDGGVQAEWYSPTERFEIYFEADGEIAAWTENRVTGVEFEAEGTEAVQLLLDWASRANNEHTLAA